MFINRLDRGIGLNTDTPKAHFHIKSACADQVAQSILLEHKAGSTGWNLRAVDDGDNSLQVGYNSATGNNFDAQTASTFVTVKSSGDVVFQGDIDSTSVSIANWEVSSSSNHLVFKYNGDKKMRIDDNGDLVVKGNVTAYGTP